MRAVRWLAAWCLLAQLGACDRKLPPKSPALADEQTVTAGAPLLRFLPPAADALLEVDLGRLRRNEVIGGLVGRATHAPEAEQAQGLLPVDLVRDADVIVAAVYDLGGAAAATVVLVRGEAVDAERVARGAPDATSAIDAHTFVFGEPALRGQVVALAEAAATGDAAAADEDISERPNLTDDDAFIALRARSMPAMAPGASLRLTARLSKEARIAGAGRMGVDELPLAVTAWGDVLDDVAVVAELDADDAAGAARLVTALERGARLLARVGLDVPLDKLKIERDQARVRIVWTVGPKALEAWVARLERSLAAQTPPEPEAAAPSTGAP